jgi:RNA polymerase sigma-70 factor (ECF subfamily)
MSLPVSDMDMTLGGNDEAPVPVEDFVSLQRAATGENEAQRALALRLVARVRRAASVLMPGSQDAQDAAQQALIEALRAAHSYQGDVSVEAWADALVSVSLVRFARAVRRRVESASARLLDETTGEPPRPIVASSGLTALETALVRMSEVRREALVLHHVYGFSLERIADVAQCSSAVARERLLLARQDMREMALATRSDAAKHAAGVRKWAALRDREAVGEILSDDELDDCGALERDDIVVRTCAEQLRELANLLDRASLQSASEHDRAVVERVLRAVRVSTSGTRSSGDDGHAELDHSIDPEGPFWLRGGAMLITTLLSVGVVIALLMYDPKPPQVAAKAQTARPVARPAPQVMSLVHARTAARGNQPSRAGELLAADSTLREGDVLRIEGNPACIALGADAELCMNKQTDLRLTSLSLATRSVELLAGHLVIKRSPAPEQPLFIQAGDVRAVADGSLFGLEREPDGDVRIRVLQGEVLIRGDGWSSKVSVGQLGIYRHSRGTLVIESLPVGQMTREWELHATGERGAGIGTSPARAVDAGVDPEKSSAKNLKSADELMMEGAEHARAERWVEAVNSYEEVLRQHRGTQEARIVLVRLGELRLERRHEPERALVAFQRYLDEGAGPLQAEAQYGVIRALLELNRTEAAHAAIAQFLNKYPNAPHVDELRAVLRAKTDESGEP